MNISFAGVGVLVVFDFDVALVAIGDRASCGFSAVRAATAVINLADVDVSGAVVVVVVVVAVVDRFFVRRFMPGQALDEKLELKKLLASGEVVDVVVDGFDASCELRVVCTIAGGLLADWMLLIDLDSVFLIVDYLLVLQYVC